MLIFIQVLLRRHTAQTAAKTTSEASGHYRIVFPQPAQGAGPEGRLWLPVLPQRPAGPTTSPTAQRCSRLHLPHGDVLFLPGQGGEETSPRGRAPPAQASTPGAPPELPVASGAFKRVYFRGSLRWGGAGLRQPAKLSPGRR